LENPINLLLFFRLCRQFSNEFFKKSTNRPIIGTMILNRIQKLGAAKTTLAITVASILGALALEIAISLILGHTNTETIIKCIIYPAIISPIVSYAIVKAVGSAAALRESEERYREILDNIEDGYFEVDLKGNLLFSTMRFAA